MPRVFGRSLARSRAASALIALATPFVAYAQVQTYAFNIPADDLGTALRTFARQAHQQVAFDGALVAGKKNASVVGTYAAADAIRTLLEGTGLTARIGSKGEFLVTASDITDASSTTQSERKTELEEVLVTAQKKSERLQDTPVAISVVNPDHLSDTHQVQLRDYFSSVPGLYLSPNITGYQNITIRGITTGGLQAPTVGVIVDDVPFGASLGDNQGNLVPDIDPGDLERIEVLRGPQGTLYGADSMGGLIKYVTKQPSPDGYSGRVSAGADWVKNGAEPGFDVRGSINVPLSDSAAIRASIFTRQDAGYIDNISNGQRGVNEAEADGEKFAALWEFDSLSITLNALYQTVKADGLAEINKAVHGYTGPALGDLQQNYLPFSGAHRDTAQAYSANIKYKIGSAELTSITGYNDMRSKSHVDFTALFGGPGGLAAKFYPGVTGSIFDTIYHTQKFSQEVRLATPIGERIEVLVGSFYTRETDPDDQVNIDANDQATGKWVGLVGSLELPVTFSEYAAFADITYRITDQFDVQVGGRVSHYTNQNDTETDFGPSVTHSPAVTPPFKASGTPATYLFTPRYKITHDFMVYARLASGYRPGGGNNDAVQQMGAPAAYAADKTKSYEIGAKADLLDHMLSLGGSLFYIDWNDIQLQLNRQGYAYTSNGGGAKSQGFELSADIRPTTGLTLRGWISYSDAEVNKAFGPNSTVAGNPGDRLPDSPRFSANLSFEQDIPLSNGMTGFAGGAVSYIGDRTGVFQPADIERQDFPSYVKADLLAGVRNDSWSVNLYANNVTDERGILNGGVGYTIPWAFLIIQPRTIGVSFTKTL